MAGGEGGEDGESGWWLGLEFMVEKMLRVYSVHTTGEFWIRERDVLLTCTVCTCVLYLGLHSSLLYKSVAHLTSGLSVQSFQFCPLPSSSNCVF